MDIFLVVAMITMAIYAIAMVVLWIKCSIVD
jgi:hypothetical protein